MQNQSEDIDEKELIEYRKEEGLFHNRMFIKAINFVKEFDEGRKFFINDIIEMFNVLEYFEHHKNDLKLTTEQKRVITRENIVKLNRVIGKYFNAVNDDNIKEIIGNVDDVYEDCIWYLIEKYEVYQRISSNVFTNIICSEKCNIELILSNKKIVYKFDNEIKNALKKNVVLSVHILIKCYFGRTYKTIYLPKSLTLEDKEYIFNMYIESENPHLETLFNIVNLPVNKECIISDATRAKALKKYNKMNDDLFKDKNNFVYSTNIQVSISEVLSEKKGYKLEINDDNYIFTLSGKWIKKNLDYPTLLNNFIYLLELVDCEFRINMISKPNTFSTLERIFMNNDLKNQYVKDTKFDLINRFVLTVIIAYCTFLKRNCKIRIEKVLQWFFDTYLNEEFGINDFIVNMPSVGCTYLEKCRLICCEMEGVIKQYNFFVANGKIDHDVIEISSLPVDYNKINSLIENKNLYLDKNKCDKVLWLLFSNQAMLTYLPGRPDLERCECFYDLLKKNKVNICEYEKSDIKDLEFLCEERIIIISDKGDISFIDIKEINLLYDIYINEFASTSYYKKNDKRSLDSLDKRGWVTYDSHLLSRQESDYFNFYLNKSVFTNGSDLRNKYLHGTQKKRGNDIKLHKGIYHILLMLFILLVIKINDELCLYADISNK